MTALAGPFHVIASTDGADPCSRVRSRRLFAAEPVSASTQPQLPLGCPSVHDRQRPGRVEVVFERGRELSPLALIGASLRQRERVAEGLRPGHGLRHRVG